MISIGSLIGAALGFKAGSFFGLIVGAFIGSAVETWIAENIFGKPSRQTQTQHAYFEALFISIGKLAKIDGIVTKDEIQKCENVMQRMQLSQEQRKLAISLFDRGKQDNFDIQPTILNFARKSGRSYTVRQMFLEMLLEVASAGGRINLAEWQLLLNICQQLGFPQQLFVALARMRGFNVGNQYQSHSGRQSQQWRPPSQQKTNSYEMLGVSASDSKPVIRRAYKKLMSSHHPDKLIAKGLPPEMIEIAKKQTQNIQAAWEDVKQMRGF
ncbi:MAG: co-chaperone DjlA [Proteobacteria bacterium]|nr:co-chaperone DjlA [Pseudomonadota bacterium]